jgi:N-acylneuraminate cytidylyltransferase
VVAARCKKLDIPLLQGVDEKPEELVKMLKHRSIPAEEVIYIGNDLNDLPCFPLVGFSAVPANALPEMKRAADLVLRKNGGYGAVRELCDILISRFAK